MSDDAQHRSRGEEAGRVGSSGPAGGLTYKDAGVDIDAGNEVVRRIRHLVVSTQTEGVISELGGFGGLFALPPGLTEPVLVSGTDGVGTKLRLAFDLGIHDTVGVDLVAMCVNDIAVCGARPLFFLDYFATGELSPEQAHDVIAGIAEGCRQAGCALLGGETAELPGFYSKGEYELAGFAVGVVERSSMITGAAVAAGDRVLGLASSGLHSNGYSLARKALLEVQGLGLDAQPAPLPQPVGRALLTPTRIYARTVGALCDRLPVHGFAHITGGGLVDNPPRILGPGLAMVLEPSRWTVPPIFELIAAAGVPVEEMRRTFNLGIGMLVVVDPRHADEARAIAEAAGETVFDIGEVVAAGEQAGGVIFR
jgi:phosphoribosylformylglycinamidine cyclo-ligase